MDLSGQTAVVTGAGSGIGRAIALRLASEGAKLTLVGRRRAPLKKTAAACIDAGASEALVKTADISDRAAVERAFSAAAKQNGPIDALVANAGIGGANEPTGDGDRFDELVATNVNGTYHCLRAAESRLAKGPDARRQW